MDIARAIKHLFPSAQPLHDYLVVDNGNGAEIAEWRLPVPVPTHAELVAAEGVALLADAKSDGLRRIADFAKAKRAEIAGTKDDAELAGWVNKLRIAQAVAAGTATEAETAILSAEVQARQVAGETLQILVAKILANGAFLAQATALIDGIKRRAEDAVAVAGSPAAVAQVLVDAQGWAAAAFAALMADQSQ